MGVKLVFSVAVKLSRFGSTSGILDTAPSSESPDGESLSLTLHEAIKLALKQNPLLDFAIPFARGPILIYARIE